MSAPRLNRRMVLETRTSTSDGAGGVTGDWVALGTLWADLRAMSGRELAQAGLPVSRQGYRAVMRAAPPGDPARPAPAQRFRMGARIFAIEAVAEWDRDGRGREGRYLLCRLSEEILA